jgi:hypothetical protein
MKNIKTGGGELSRKLLTILVLSAMTTLGYAADNSIYIDQAGDNSTINMTQDGAGNKVKGILANGTAGGNTDPVKLTGDAQTVNITQTGANNVLTLGINSTQGGNVANNTNIGVNLNYQVSGGNNTGFININNNGSVNIMLQNGMNVNTSLPMLRTFNVGVSIPLEFKIKKKTIVTESNTNNEKSLKSLENTVQKFININLDDYNVPSDLYDVAVDVTNDPYGRLECNVSFLFKKPFSLNDSNKLHHILKEIKKEIVSYFGDTFYHISSGVSTVDVYNNSKSRDKNQVK